MEEFKNISESILNSYLEDYRGPFGSDRPSYRSFYQLQEWLTENIIANRDDLNVKFSVGKGNWTQVPWFAILNNKEADDTRNGFYIVCLFQHSMEGFYLCIGQGITGPIEKYGKKGGSEYLSEKAIEVKNLLQEKLNGEFKFDTEISLKATGGIALNYGPGVCLHQYIGKENIPNDESITTKLINLIEAYDLMIENKVSSNLIKKLSKKNSWVIAAGKNAELKDNFLNENIISIGWEKLGNLKNYKTKKAVLEKIKGLYGEGEESDNNPTNQALACYEFANNMKIGDSIYLKKGGSLLLAAGEIKSDYIFDENRNGHSHIRKIEWYKVKDFNTQDELGHRIALKTLTNFTDYPDTLKKIEEFYFKNDNLEIQQITNINHEELLKDTFFSRDTFLRLNNTLLNKKNIIIQGAPGVGKTFIGKKLALFVTQNDKNIESLVLHENYSYEEFIMGIRPDENGNFKISDGVFYKFCKKAINNPLEKFVLILDEINRANITKIFGELLVLIEDTKRNKNNAVKLMYKNDEYIYVPQNLFIIGLMNTADRSLKVVDYALRRRFSFFTFEPQFDSSKFKDFLINKQVNLNTANKLIKNLLALNKRIADDTFDLGAGFCIGHSFFCPTNSKDLGEEWYEEIINNQIVPLIEEYYFDKPEIIEEIKTDLLS